MTASPRSETIQSDYTYVQCCLRPCSNNLELEEIDCDSVASAGRRRDDRRNKKKKKKWSFPYPLDSRAGYIGPVCCRSVLFRVHVAACAVWLSYPGLLPGVFVSDQADMQAVDERVREFRQVRCNDPS